MDGIIEVAVDAEVEVGLKLKWELTPLVHNTDSLGLRHLHHVQVMLLGRQCLYGVGYSSFSWSK